MLHDVENWQGEKECLTVGDAFSYRLALSSLPLGLM